MKSQTFYHNFGMLEVFTKIKLSKEQVTSQLKYEKATHLVHFSVNIYRVSGFMPGTNDTITEQ